MNKDQAEVIILEFEKVIQNIIYDMNLAVYNKYHKPNPNKYQELGDAFRAKVTSYIKE